MSRSRKKYYKSQYVPGNDRPFKIEGRRTLRTANKRMLQNLLSHHDLETVSDEAYHLRWVSAMDPWAWPSDASGHCFYGTEEQFLQKCEADWEQHERIRCRYPSKEEYIRKMQKEYRKGVNK